MENGIQLFYRGTSGVFEYFLLEDLKEWELLDLVDKYYCLFVHIVRCDCGKLYEDAKGECPRCTIWRKINERY